MVLLIRYHQGHRIQPRLMLWAHREWVWEDGRFWGEVYFDITEDEWAARG